MVLVGSFIAAMAIAWLMVRRSDRLARWLGLAALLFCVVAGLARLAGDGRTARIAARLYDAGDISWNDYRAAVVEMLERTSTTYAPWTVVEAENKLWARIRTLTVVTRALEKRLERA